MPIPNTDPDLSFLDDTFTEAGVVDESSSENTGADTQSGTGTESSQSASTQDKVEGAAGEDKLGSDSDKAKQLGKEKEGQVAPPAEPELKPGDIKLKDGAVVRAGAERRWYDSMNLARARETQTRSELNTAVQQRDAIKTKYDALETSVKQMGFDNPEHFPVAVSLFRDLQSDPVGTVTKLLAELKAKGYTVDGIGSQVDTRAITSILDQRLKPSEQQQQQEQQQQLAQQVDQEVNQLITTFPDALTHEAHIAAVVDAYAAQGQQISLMDAYFGLRQKAIEMGLDWSKPLSPQIEAQKAQAAPHPAPIVPGQPPRQQGKPVVGQQSDESNPAQVFTPENDSTSAIIRAAMREQGLNV